MKYILSIVFSALVCTSALAKGGSAAPFIDSNTLNQHFNGQAGPQKTVLYGRIIHWTADASGKPVASKSLPSCYNLKSQQIKQGENCFYPQPSRGGSR